MDNIHISYSKILKYPTEYSKTLLSVLVLILASASCTKADYISDKIDDNTPPQNEIWYTTINDEKIDINFDAAIVSHTYYNGKGIITFEKKLSKIPSKAFSRCENLESIELPSNINTIGNAVFSGAYNLTHVKLPNNLTSMGWSIFDGCEKLDNVKIPHGVTMIDKTAFDGCVSLTNIELPSALKTIAEGAFQDCTSLVRIELPDNITSIRHNAFERCFNLKSVYIKAKTPPQLGDNVFLDCPATFYVPKKALKAYESQWNQYSSSRFVGYNF